MILKQLNTCMDKKQKQKIKTSKKKRWANNFEQTIQKRRLMNGQQAYEDVLNISHSEIQIQTIMR